MNSEELATDPLTDQNEWVAAEIDCQIVPLAGDDAEREVWRYMRYRTGLEAERDRIKQCCDALLNDIDRKIASADLLHRAFAESYTRAHLSGKSRFIRTPFGTLGFRRQPAHLIVVDEEACLQSELPPDCIKLSASIVKSALNEHVARTGELPSGCDMAPAEDRFYTKGE